VPRFLARVWPAVALGPVQGLVALVQGRLGIAIANSPVASEILSRLAPRLASVTGEGVADVRPAGPAPSPSPQSGSDGEWIPEEDRLPLLVALAACAGLLALLSAAVRRDLRSMSRYRWRH
jgi:hypothetical protein